MLLPHIRRTAVVLLLSLVALRTEGRGYDSIAAPEETFAVLDGVAYFAADEGLAQANLWRTDGTAEGTRRVSQLAPGVTVRQPFVAGDRIIYFVQNGPALGIWEANGNTYETRLVTELANVQPKLIATAEGIAYFTSPDADRGPHSTFLWRSDGTAAGTGLVTSLPFELDQLAIHQGLLFFRREYEQSLWRSDGTSLGTFSLEMPVSPVLTADGMWDVIAGAANGRVFFNSDDDVWQSDGTKEGTSQLRRGARMTSAATLHGATYLTIGTSLYRLDGDALTLMAAPPRPFAPPMRGLVSTGERLYFFYDGLWTTDSSGTRPVRKLDAPDPFRRVRLAGGLLYFTHHENLWRSDGTSAGTFSITNLPVYSDVHDTPGALTALNGKLLFAGSENIHGREPWISDGTSAGTRLVANVRPETVLRGRVYDRESGAPVTAQLYLETTFNQVFTIATDAEGRFSIDGLVAGSYSLSAEEAYPYLRQMWRNHDCGQCSGQADPLVVTAEGGVLDGIDFPLTRRGSISGRIVDRDGAPVAMVRVDVAEDVSGSSVVASGFSDANGEYETFGVLPPGPRWFVLASSRTHSGMIYDGGSCALSCESAANVKPVAVANGQAVTGIDFVMTPYGSIRGRILDGLTGRPIEVSATITGRNPYERRVAYSSSGAYELRLHDGEYLLLGQVAGGAYTSAYYPNVPCSDPGCAELRGVPVSAVPGKTIPGYDLVVMPLGARVRGRVADGATGAPLSGIRITVLDRRGVPVARTLTKSNGTYETPPSLAPGTYRVRAERSDGHASLTHAADVTVSGTDIVRGIDFLLDRLAAIAGTVVDAKTRHPLIGAEVVITDAAGTVVETIHTGADGRYAVPLLPGRFAVHAEKIGWMAKDAQVSVINGETGSVAFTLEPACDVAISPVSPVARNGGEKTLSVSAPCAVCAFETASFFSILHGGCNSPVLTLRFDENPGPARRGTIVFPGTVVEIVQEGR
jgi:ELWxxDGT repeat protein